MNENSLTRWIVVLLLAASARVAPAAEVAVFFSPNGGCTTEIVRRISRAETSIDVSAYSFSSPPIGAALIDAKNRGITVRVVVDAGQESLAYSTAAGLAAAGIDVMADDRHAIFHNKTIIIDQSITITGSFNFTTSAEKRNAENLIVIADDRIAAKYAENFALHYGHSRPYNSKHKPRADSFPEEPSLQKRKSCNGTRNWTSVFTRRFRENWRGTGCRQVEGPQLFSETRHSEKSEKR